MTSGSPDLAARCYEHTSAEPGPSFVKSLKEFKTSMKDNKITDRSLCVRIRKPMRIASIRGSTNFNLVIGAASRHGEFDELSK
jgi:hypothetical protein